MATIPDFSETVNGTTPQTLPLSTALSMAEALALGSLPTVHHERVSCAMGLMKAGKVLQLDDGSWEVESASVPGKIYGSSATGRKRPLQQSTSRPAPAQSRASAGSARW